MILETDDHLSLQDTNFENLIFAIFFSLRYALICISNENS